MKKVVMCLMVFGLLVVPAIVRAATISTTFASNNGSAGNIFDLRNISTNPIQLTGYFEGNFDSGAIGTVQIWYRNGTHVGYDTATTGWSLLGSATIASAVADTPTPFNVGNTLTVAANQTFGMFMYFSYQSSPGYPALNYTDGTMSYSDGTILLTNGVGKTPSSSTPPVTGETISDRIWNGTIEYTAAPIPGALLLLGPGLLGLAAVRRRFKK